MVVQDRVQLAPPLLVGGVIAGPRKQITEAEEAAYQRPATWSQKAESLTSPNTSNDGLGFVLENHRLRGDSAHGSARVTCARVTRRSGAPSLARPAKLLHCQRRLPAASKAAHVPTVAPSTTRRSAKTSSVSRERLRDYITLLRQGYESGATLWPPGLWMRRHHNQERGCRQDQECDAELRSITTARVEMPPVSGVPLAAGAATGRRRGPRTCGLRCPSATSGRRLRP